MDYLQEGVNNILNFNPSKVSIDSLLMDTSEIEERKESQSVFSSLV